MRICFVCDTPYQILNCINYVYHKKQEQEMETDLYIGRNFADVEGVYVRLKGTGLFEKIFMYDMPQLKGPRRRLRKLIELRFPRKYISRVIQGNKHVRADYAQVWCTIPTEFSMAMLFLCKSAEMIHFDDGTGSYHGNINDIAISDIRNRVYPILGMDIKRLEPKALFVNNTNLCKSKITNNILALPNLKNADEKLCNMIKDVFMYQGDGYYNKYKLIYLTHPEEVRNENDIKTEAAVIDVFKRYEKDVLIRPHPRKKDVGIEELNIDKYNDMWEMVCAEQITDEHVLAGMFSTAQFVPKLIFEKEPFLIFTYKLYQEIYSKERMKEFETMIADIKLSYSMPQKIMEPQNIDEFKEYVRTIMR